MPRGVLRGSARRVLRHVHPDRLRRRRRRAGRAEQGHARARYLSINIAWGLAVTMGCYVSAGVTGRAPESGGDAGARRAPAVSVGQGAARTRIAQLAGAFVASAVVYRHLSRGARPRSTAACVRSSAPQGTAGIWATYPQPFLSTFPGGFIDQVVGTALLVARDLRHHRQPQLAGAGRPRAGRRRPAGRADRRDLRLQFRLRHQPGARFRPAAVHVRRRVGRRGVSRGQRLVVGADRRAAASAASLGGWVYDVFVGHRFPSSAA